MILYWKYISSFCGYTNYAAYENFNDEDVKFIENFVRCDLLDILHRKFEKQNAILDQKYKANFFGCYVADVGNFRFSPDESKMIKDIIAAATNTNELDELQKKQILDNWKAANNCYFDKHDPDSGMVQRSEVVAPTDSINILTKLLSNARINSNRSKHGYRYDDHSKRFGVFLRTVGGPSAYKTLRANLVGSIPSIEATNKYIYRSHNKIIEGVLRADELVSYLKDRKLPLCVSLSEDATAIENRVQYDSHSNQLVGFVLPIDEKTGMPQPYMYPARNAAEMVRYFSNGTPISTVVNTIMAQPIGSAAPFCLLIFGSNNKYTSNNVSNRWKYVTNELTKLGVRVITVSSDSDPKFNTAMRTNSKLGCLSQELLCSDIFKCGHEISEPFYTQDVAHILTKLRNLLFKTTRNSEIFRFGAKYFITIDHLRTLIEKFRKDEHCLSQSCLDSNDRQNVDSALRICSENVIDMIRMHVPGSEATVLFLQIMADSFASYMAPDLTVVDRIEKMWHAVFLTRIWRYFVLNHPNLTLKDNFMSSNCYSCLEQNAHSLVQIILFLREHNLPELFIPSLFNSQPCEQFYRKLRSFTPTFSTVVSCSVKQLLSRVSKIHLLNEISHIEPGLDGFIYPDKTKTSNCFKLKYPNELPTKNIIFQAIEKSKSAALQAAIKVGLIKNSTKEKKMSCVCHILPPKMKKPTKKNDIRDAANIHDTNNLLLSRLNANLKLKNFAHLFPNGPLEDTSSYVDIPGYKKRFICKKTSYCWLLRKESPKLSSDRLLRVRGARNTKKPSKARVHHYNKKTSAPRSFRSLRLRPHLSYQRSLFE